MYTLPLFMYVCCHRAQSKSQTKRIHGKYLFPNFFQNCLDCTLRMFQFPVYAYVLLHTFLMLKNELFINKLKSKKRRRKENGKLFIVCFNTIYIPLHFRITNQQQSSFLSRQYIQHKFGMCRTMSNLIGSYDLRNTQLAPDYRKKLSLFCCLATAVQFMYCNQCALNWKINTIYLCNQDEQLTLSYSVFANLINTRTIKFTIKSYLFTSTNQI